MAHIGSEYLQPVHLREAVAAMMPLLRPCSSRRLIVRAFSSARTLRRTSTDPVSHTRPPGKSIVFMRDTTVRGHSDPPCYEGHRDCAVPKHGRGCYVLGRKRVIKICNWKNIRGNSHTASRTPPSQPLLASPQTEGDRTRPQAPRNPVACSE